MFEARLNTAGKVLEANCFEVAHEQVGLEALHLAVLHGATTEVLIQLNRLKCVFKYEDRD